MNITSLRNNSRFMGLTMFDIVLTFVSAYLLYNAIGLNVDKVMYYASLMPLTYLIHITFGVGSPFVTGVLSGNILYNIILIGTFVLTVIRAKAYYI